MSANNSSLQITKSPEGTLIQLSLLIPHEKVERRPIIVISDDEEGQEVMKTINDRCDYDISNIRLRQTANNLLTKKKETRMVEIGPQVGRQQNTESSNQMRQSPPRITTSEIQRYEQRMDRTREKHLKKESNVLQEENERQKKRL